jgi:hypothetical protein
LSTILVGSATDSWGVWFPDDPKQTPYTRYQWIEIVEQDMYPCEPDAPLPIAQRTAKYPGVPSVSFSRFNW